MAIVQQKHADHSGEEIVEKGDIFFFYRPRVENSGAEGLSDIQGVYALVRRGRNLHLTYEIELPERPGPVQQDLNIPRQGSFILSIRNPEAPSPPAAGLPPREEAHYPKSLQREFRRRRFAAADPRLLDYEGAEFILIGARADPQRAYDLDIAAEHESADSADIFKTLRLSRREHPLEPLFAGKWR